MFIESETECSKEIVKVRNSSHSFFFHEIRNNWTNTKMLVQFISLEADTSTKIICWFFKKNNKITQLIISADGKRMVLYYIKNGPETGLLLNE